LTTAFYYKLAPRLNVR